mmetsp:Transcript_32198/g.90171  ORF Transcript_32198/g.90171 Transcript_32198/m.90171 type:complete len:85 (-) Transcript_32198:387-641(-)
MVPLWDMVARLRDSCIVVGDIDGRVVLAFALPNGEWPGACFFWAEESALGSEEDRGALLPEIVWGRIMDMGRNPPLPLRLGDDA